jgi:hypothetical protein
VKLASILVTLSVLVLVVLGSAGDFGSPDARNLLTPAGIAFSIWFLIFALAIGYAIEIWRGEDAVAARIAAPLGLTFALTGSWAWLFPHLPFVGREVLQLATVAAAGFALRGLPRVEAESTRRRWLVRAPTTLIAGWLSVAVVVATTEQLLERGITEAGLGAPAWAAILIAVATALGAGVELALRRGRGFPLAIAWGLVWIAWARREAVPLLAVEAASGALALVVLALVRGSLGATIPSPVVLSRP